MKNTNTNKWQITTALLFVITIVFVILSIFVFNGKGLTDDGFLFPDALTLEIMPDSIQKGDTISTHEMVRRSDNMIRKIYRQSVGTSQGGNQLKLFFTIDTWKKPWNVFVYLFSAMTVVFLAYLLRTTVKKKLRTRPWPERLLENNLHHIIPIFLLAVFLTAMINPSIPLNKKLLNYADPLFAFVCMSSLAISGYAFAKMLRMTRSPKFTAKSNAVRKNHQKNTLLWAGLAGWTLAFLCYFIGLFALGTQRSLLTNLLRPALSATKMFVLADNVNDISYVLRQNGAFMGFFSFTKVYVIIITSVSILSLVWYRISNYFKLRWADSAGKILYIFWGVNPNSLLIAKKVRDHHQEKKNNDYLMLFIDCKENSGDAFVQSPTLGKFFKMFTHKRETFEAVEELDSHLIIVNTDISGKECSELLKDNVKDLAKGNIWKDLELGLIEDFICNSAETRMFFLHEDESRNIQGTFNVAEMLKETETSNKTTLFSCVKKDGMGNTLLSIEDDFPDKRVEIRILDTSQLAVMTLVRSNESLYHPIYYVEDVDYQKASVGSAFNSCVIGFGETGQEMVGFLYKFGAFLDSKCAGENSRQTYRSTFHCDIFDEDVISLKAQFKEKAPEAFKACNVKLDEKGKAEPNMKDPLLRFHKGLPFHESSYPEKMPDFGKMNYIAICLGKDDLNMNMLSMLMDILVRARKGKMDHLLVLVRNHSEANEDAMRRLQDHYNSLYGKDARGVVKIFGQKDTLFTYGNVIDDEINAYAKLFYDHYRMTEDSNVTWEQRHVQRKSLTRLENVNSIKRKESQDLENYIHIATKLQLMGIEANDPDKARCLQYIEDCNDAIRFVTDKDGIKTTVLDSHHQIITNLARTEHLRWVASHEILGYTPNHDEACDELTKTHNCLVPWESLPEVSKRYNDYETAHNPHNRHLLDYKTFDYLVIKTMFEIVLERFKSDTQKEG